MEADQEKPIIPQKGTDCPALKFLYRYVRPEITGKWHDIGVELFNIEDEVVLNTIKTNNPGDADKCTAEMLQLWRERQPDGSWNQLIQALKAPSIRLEALASKIEGMLCEGGSDVTEHKVVHDRKRKQRVDIASDPDQPLPSDIKKIKTTEMDVADVETDFNKYNVVDAFTKLMTILQDNTPESRLPIIITRLKAVIEGKFKASIEKQKNVESFFDLLSDNDLYCNWLDVSLLRIIIIALGNEKLWNLINKYITAIHSKKLREVWDFIPQKKIRSKYYSEVTKTFDSKNPDDVTVEELITCNKELAYKVARLVKVVKNCVTITSLVPTDKVYQLFLSMLTAPQESRKEDFLQIGTWVVHHPKSVLQELRIEFATIASPLTLLIGYYHGLLLRDINADLLFNDMCSKDLLNVDDWSFISGGHSVHHKNWLLLEYIRHMKTDNFLLFCQLVHSIWPGVGSQLITAFNAIPKFQKGNSEDLEEAQIISYKLYDQFLYFKPSSVHIEFLCLFDQLNQLLQYKDIEVLVAQCENMMASVSEQESVKLFSDSQIAKMKESKTTLVMWELSFFFTWSNHSILRILLSGYFSEALRLLDVFDSRVDPLLSIASYPIPYFSSDMIPVDTSAYTILAIRCDQELYKGTLQYVYDMQSVMMEKCHLTQHCLQLLAVKNDPTILYWTIPKCVVKLITNQVPCHSEYLYSKGILEVLVYPKLLLSTGDDISIGSSAFIAENDASNEEFDDTELSTKEIQKILQADNINTRFRDLNMSLQVKDTELQNKVTELRIKQKQLESKNKENKELHEKITKAKLANDHINRQAEQLNSKLLEMDKKNQLSSSQMNKLLEKSEKRNEQLNSKLREVTEKKNQVDEENLKINSELRANNAKLIELDKQIKQLKSELQILVQKEEKSNKQDDNASAKYQLKKDNVIDSEDTEKATLLTSKLDQSTITGAKAVSILSNRVSQINIFTWFMIDDNAWPPVKQASFTPLLFFHYHGDHSNEEIRATAELMYTGNIDKVAMATDKQSNKLDGDDKLHKMLHTTKATKEIAEILVPLEKSEDPAFILVEGAPGIGKSMLLKEISYRWANKELLQKFELVILIYLRDPSLQQIVSVSDLLQLFCIEDDNAAQIASACALYLFANGGKTLTLLLDGYNEYPVHLQESSLVSKILKRQVLPLCGLVVSSRPHASVHLRIQATIRVNVLGFTETEREHFIKQALPDQPDKIEELTEYLHQKPSVDSICFIPFNMVILLYLYKLGIPLPSNSAELYHHFICSTITRHLSKLGNPLTSNKITNLTDLPEPCNRIIKQLSKLSLEALNSNKLVFTLYEITSACPDITAIPEAINGFGLLQAVQQFGRYAKTITLNFIHFTIQEYLAALYITQLPPNKELKVIEAHFWSNIHFNVFSIYISLTKGQRSSFKNFLSGGFFRKLFSGGRAISSKFLEDQLKCIRLYYHLKEASNQTLCNTIERAEVFNNKVIRLGRTTLTGSDIECVSLFLASSFNKEWEWLDLYNCYIQDKGLSTLWRKLRHTTDITINMLWLQHNGLTVLSSSLISELTLRLKVKELMIVGNKTIGEDQQLYTMLSNPSSVLKALYMEGTQLSSTAAIDLFTSLRNNHKLKKLNINYNEITDDACDAITAALKSNRCLDKLSIRDNPLSSEAKVNIVQCLEANDTLQVIWLPDCLQATKEIIRSLQNLVNNKRARRGCQVILKIEF